MKRNIKIAILLRVGIPIIVFSLFLIGCSQDVTPSLYDNVGGSAPTPIIIGISPEEGLAGITEFTITGENFSTVLEENAVYFGSNPAIILSATETQLNIIPPNVVQDSIIVKMNTTAELFSNNVYVNLISAANEVYSFADFELPYAITSDKVGNIYLSLVSDNAGKGIKKLTPHGELLDFAPKGGETFYTGLQYGPEGKLYGARGGARAIFVIVENTAPATFAVFENGTSMIDLDFDKNHNIWVAGKGGKIYRVPSNPTSSSDWKSFEFEPDVSAVKIYNDYIYLAAKSDISQDIFRMKIVSDDSLGSAEVYFPFSTNYDPIINVNAITFSADGQLFIGTNDLDPIKFVNLDGSFGTWYTGVLSPEIISFTWGTGNELYLTRARYSGSTQTILAVNMEKTGAPQYGRE